MQTKAVDETLNVQNLRAQLSALKLPRRRLEETCLPPREQKGPLFSQHLGKLTRICRSRGGQPNIGSRLSRLRP